MEKKPECLFYIRDDALLAWLKLQKNISGNLGKRRDLTTNIVEALIFAGFAGIASTWRANLRSRGQ
ncbi:hypothetical protein CS022_00780 [Veronia nyctiphanis]|uniref:Uncharacterized protein n=1 Tax=Veronia nyctiphanis TaxID=1278244 RepID=A0A4Q0Z059_9GAMM|nr:hypothetical protein CS022_00780 [Veronia nyctiphanis]